MTALATTDARHPHNVNKLLRVVRHRVVRWFRPTEADLLRSRLELEPHPYPTVRSVDDSHRTGAAS